MSRPSKYILNKTEGRFYMRSDIIGLKGQSRFLRLVLARPLAFGAACGFLSLGTASGISTGSLLNMEGLLFIADKPLWYLSLLRTAGFDLLLLCAVQSAVYHKAALPFACAALSLKGLAMGFTIRQLLLELRFMQAFPAVLTAVFSSFPVLTALLVSFLCTGLGAENDEMQRGANCEKACYSSKLSFFLAVMGVAAEGLAAPVLLRLFYNRVV